MQCLSCGSDIGKNLGLCPKCAAKRRERKLLETQQQQDYAEKDYRRNKWILLLASPFILIASVLLAIAFLKNTPYDILSTGGSVTVRTGYKDASLTYRLAGFQVHEGRIFEYGLVSKSMYQESGIKVWLRYLTEADYKEFEDIERSGRCAASFLNAHMRHLFIIPASAEEADTLKSATVRQGDSLRLEGKALVFKEGIFKGRPYGGIQLMSGGDFFYPETFLAQGRNILR